MRFTDFHRSDLDAVPFVVRFLAVDFQNQHILAQAIPRFHSVNMMAEDKYQRSLTVLEPVPWIVQPNVRGSTTPALATAPADVPFLDGNVDRNIAGVLPRVFRQPRQLLRAGQSRFDNLFSRIPFSEVGSLANQGWSILVVYCVKRDSMRTSCLSRQQA